MTPEQDTSKTPPSMTFTEIHAVAVVAHRYFIDGVVTGVTGLNPRDYEDADEPSRRSLAIEQTPEWQIGDYEKAAQMFAAALSAGTCDPGGPCWCDCHQAAYRPEKAPPCSGRTCRLRLAATELAPTLPRTTNAICTAPRCVPQNDGKCAAHGGSGHCNYGKCDCWSVDCGDPECPEHGKEAVQAQIAAGWSQGEYFNVD